MATCGWDGGLQISTLVSDYTVVKLAVLICLRSLIIVTEEDFELAIDELSPSAAAGHDGFPALLLKNVKLHFSMHSQYSGLEA